MIDRVTVGLLHLQKANVSPLHPISVFVYHRISNLEKQRNTVLDQLMTNKGNDNVCNPSTNFMTQRDDPV